ncbi:DUF3108 domain-containing protein [Photobacterium sp. SDRW27]|uniref:DUF3108 domain-containing protein n=1 Tax=Photobacterium obscurum TaxID=2829490 RepID=UPI0022439566|nr:DUF3108 domain-containing protein [Photobacterium obscurum]MCW8331217.1 DUF3108 domain-containing protein [Photobacterium obscurum]
MKRIFAVMLLWLCSLLSSWAVQSAPQPIFHQCNKVFTYDLYWSDLKIGHFTRTLKWQNNRVDIHSYSKVDLMVTKTKLKQDSKVYWSEQQNSFLTHSFKRKITGLMAGSTLATFSYDGRQSVLRSNGSTDRFSSHDLPLLDGDAVGSQLRLNLIEGKKKFEFKLQDTDEVNHYHFEVKRDETIQTHFGRVKAIRVEQTRKNDRKLVMWFAPDVDYQLVKATYKRKLINLKAILIRKKIQCPPDALQTAKKR